MDEDESSAPAGSRFSMKREGSLAPRRFERADTLSDVA
jgi:hypothetical protein